ncbi:hypothetical protein BDQ12DRAFT_730724 [Crucibulum laeve]|uniref:Actin cortical patch SUR7/pH-response regulator pali n=1 Tax=Crucibulum laeve TaxID=68775 RepID=A0A5C3MJZ5_9AGAR|nr:hypothetical protein BDQ12DRAFT_730724 [Crucibulum laeve]
MRKTWYGITFAAVLVTLLLNVISSRRPDWLVVRYPEVLHTKITVQFGLNQRCERTITEIPGGNGKITYRDYECRDFPKSVTDHCEDENSQFCAAWTSAGYLDFIAIGFAVISLVTIIFGVSTHSRRRRIWRAVAGLVLFQSLLQIVTFGIITDMYQSSRYPSFDQARPGVGYVLNILAWILGLLIATAVITTGILADKGHRWAAGSRAYLPIV